MLQKILRAKQQQISDDMQQQPPALIKELAAAAPPPRDFIRSIRTAGRVSIIAEVKRQSPSKGLLCRDFNHVKLAQTYSAGGAQAISVLTERRFFGGRPQYLADIRSVSALPLLCKDFIIHPYQVYQARALGADAVLLIAAALDDEMLSQLLRLAEQLGMAALTEVHNEAELQRAASSGAALIGINNRDLHTFRTDISTTFKLRRLIADRSVTVVSESGIKSAADIAALARCRVHAALVGEHLVTASNPARALAELVGRGEQSA